MRSSVKCTLGNVQPSKALTLILLVVVLFPSKSQVQGCGGSDAGTYRCLIVDIGRALNRLAYVPKPFYLVPGVRIEKREAEHTSLSRHNATLVDSAEHVFEDHDLVLDTAPGLQMRVTADGSEGFRVKAQQSTHIPEPRTFGALRRMKLALLPIMYKLGVITTLLTLLTVFALKGLTIGVVLLIMGSVGLASKFKIPYHDVGSGHHKDVHVHVHGGTPSHTYHSPIYHADMPWDRAGPLSSSQLPPTAHPNWSPNNPPPLNIQQSKSPWDQFIN